ncbi:hypothetical protein ACIREM_39915 [Streptomyces shenzhenensis]
MTSARRGSGIPGSGAMNGGRPERRGVPELDERQRQVRMARVAERPFG